MSTVEAGASPMRVIDETFTVVDQNGAMTALTAGQTAPVTCREQLRGPDCGTDRCSLVQLRDGTVSTIEKTVEMELPSGETRKLRLTAERYTTGTDGFEGIIESFRPVGEAGDAGRESGAVVLPPPTDAESFRSGLSEFLQQAAVNGVPIGERSWDCPAAERGSRWDVSIVPVRSKQPPE
ncbi:MAG: hypothetical protein ACLFNC_06515 [Halodesulfurarchaeum sp.]